MRETEGWMCHWGQKETTQMVGLCDQNRMGDNNLYFRWLRAEIQDVCAAAGLVFTAAERGKKGEGGKKRRGLGGFTIIEAGQGQGQE